MDLLASSTRVLLVENTYHIPPAEWRYVDIVLKQQPATVDCEFKVLSGNARVRLALVNLKELERLRKGQEPRSISATGVRRGGALQYALRDPGQYAIVVDNRARGAVPAQVELRISLDFAKQVGYLSPKRRLTVVAISLLVFVSIVTYSGRKLWRATRG